MLSHLLNDDPASPRLTVYNESTGSRMDFSAQTMENWASKIANFLTDELELDEDSHITLDLPVSWQTAMISLGALAVGVTVHFAVDESPLNEDSGERPDAVFTTAERFDNYTSATDVVLVTDDAFGRGLEELGHAVPEGAIDFGPTVRFYGDIYPGPTRPLAELVTPSTPGQRLLSTGWTGWESFSRQVLEPLAATGSAVVVAGMVEASRLEEIADNEKVTARL